MSNQRPSNPNGQAGALASVGSFVLKQLGRKRLPVFLFHKVPGQAHELTPNDLSLGEFRRVLDFIEESFDVIPLADAVGAMKSNRLPKGAACLTFDDGYADWLQGAIPELKQRGLPATFFITTGQFSNEPMWHERVAHAVSHIPGPVFDLPGFGLPALPLNNLQERQHAELLIERHLKYLPLDMRQGLIGRLEASAGTTWKLVPTMPAEDVRAIHNMGFEIGAHTINHPILSLCSPRQSEDEIGGVKETLEQMIAGKVKSFAYPNGRPYTDFGREHVDLVGRCGYQYAVTTQWGGGGRATPVFQIPRFTPWGPTELGMTLQLARNMIQRPKAISMGAPSQVRAVFSETFAKRPRRVLYVENGAGFGGAIIALSTMLEHLDTEAIEPHVVSNLPAVHFSRQKKLRSCQVIPDSMWNLRPLAKRVQAMPLGPFGQVLLFILGRVDDILNRLPYMLRLLLHARKVRPDVIHGNNEPNSNREAILIAKLLRIPYVQHLRGPLGESRHSSWLLSQPDRFIPVSRWLAGQLLVAGVPNERIRQMYDAVDTATTVDRSAARRTLQSEFGIPNHATVVAMIGMLVDWKGQHHFIEAVGRIAADNPEAVFMLIGGVPEKSGPEYSNKLRTMIAESAFSSRFIMTGQRNDLPSLLPGMDIVVSASIEPEPLGLVMVEALLAGKKFVGPAFGAATEVVHDGVDGFLFEPGSPESLADRLQLAIRSSIAGTENRGLKWSEAKRFSTTVQSTGIAMLYANMDTAH